MSGRDADPLSAFFPSIDRNLIRDLDRHLRGTHASVHEEPSREQSNARPNITGIVEAVEQAASSISLMSTRIQDLEVQHAEDEAAQHSLQVQLADAMQRYEAAEASAQNENERAQRAELFAAHHVARVKTLEQELAGALSDLARVTEAITSALGLPGPARSRTSRREH